MEPHPVPQNIIDVEFKLFGSFTLKQFSKILIGCLIGVGLFFININPIIKFPLIFGSVIIGIGLAIVPNLRVWMIGFIKALIISPRYVWLKQASIPELLQEKTVEKKASDSAELKATLSKRKLDIDELPMSVRYDVSEDSEEPGGTNEIFLKAYENMYGKNASAPVQAVMAKDSSKLENKNFASQFLSRAVQSIDINLIKPKEKVLKTRDDYLNELEMLKVDFNSLDRNAPDYKIKEQEIADRMNKVYSEFKSKVGINTAAVLQPNASQEAAAQSGKIINGIIVSLNDEPIGNAEIFLTNLFYNKKYKTVSGSDGRFSTHIPVPQGEYDIKIVKDSLRFHNYNIKISDQKPPAFKFREK